MPNVRYYFRLAKPKVVYAYKYNNRECGLHWGVDIVCSGNTATPVSTIRQRVNVATHHKHDQTLETHACKLSNLPDVKTKNLAGV